MDSSDEARDIDSPVIDALINSPRGALAELLREQELSAAELAARTKLPVEKVRYHLRIMQENGLIEFTREVQRRGVGERYYRTTRDLFVSDEEFDQLDRGEQRRVNAHFLRVALGEAADSMVVRKRAKGVARHYSVRQPLLLDGQGWDELMKLYADTWAAVEELGESAAARLKASDEQPIRATSIQLCFDATVEGDQPEAELSDESPEPRGRLL